MYITLILLALLGLLPESLHAQPSPRQFAYSATDPAGSCANGQANIYNFVLNKEWGCNAGTWTVVASGASVPTTPASPVNSIQFNNANAFGGSADFTWTATGGLSSGLVDTGSSITGNTFYAIASAGVITTVSGAIINASAEGATSANTLQGLFIDVSPDVNTTTAYAINLGDVEGATTNYAIKTGAGLVDFGDNTKAPSYSTTTNCADSAGAAACGAAPAGSVVVDAGSTSTVVSTTVVTANSQIFVMYDSSLSARLGITCNATVALPAVTARTAATSFTITIPAMPVTNPACFSYFLVN